MGNRIHAFAIPAATGVLYGIGFLLPPALGALFMSFKYCDRSNKC